MAFAHPTSAIAVNGNLLQTTEDEDLIASIKFVQKDHLRSFVQLTVRGLQSASTEHTTPRRHTIRLTAPLKTLRPGNGFTYCEYNLTKIGPLIQLPQVVRNARRSTSATHYLVHLEATQIQIEGSPLPQMANGDIQDKMALLLREAACDCNSCPFVVNALVEHHWAHDLNGDLTRLEARYVLEQNGATDPLLTWFEQARTNEVLETKSEVLPFSERPVIAKQGIKTTFIDRREYCQTLTYGAAYEEDYRKLLIAGYKEIIFDSKFVRLPGTDEKFPSTYMTFVSYIGVGVEQPKAGDTILLKLMNCEQPPVQKWDPIGEEVLTEPLPPDSNKGAVMGDSSLWDGVVIENRLTPPGHICVIVNRPEEPSWDGPDEACPLVLTEVWSISTAYGNQARFHAALEDAHITKIKIILTNFDQSYENELHACAKLLGSTVQEHEILRGYLLGHPDHRWYQSQNVFKQLFGEQDMSQLLNKLGDAQKRVLVDGLKNVRNRILAVEAAFGTGKTTTMLTLVDMLLVSNRKHRVLFTSTSNNSVDESLQRCAKTLQQLGILNEVLLIRLHPMSGEKAALTKNSKKSTSRQVIEQAKEQLTQRFLVAYELNDLRQAHATKMVAGDPRRVLVESSLTAAMMKVLRKVERNPNHSRHQEFTGLTNLLTRVKATGTEGLGEQEEQDMRQKIDSLVSLTIESATAIFTTLAQASKIDIRGKFKPDLVILDEAGRAT